MAVENLVKLRKILEAPITNSNIEKILVKVGTKVQEDIKALAPEDTGAYKNSIQLSEVFHGEDDVHTIRIYTKLNSGWKNVPLGCLLEWGTGSVGESTNTYDHGYPYRQTPWVYYNKRYGRWIFTKGNIARPHFVPGLYNNESYFEKTIKEAITNGK
jgi:hypothetical protein